MNLLLDTHAFLWFIEGNPRISQTAREAIENLDNRRFLSMASVWEIAIKFNLGKLELKTGEHTFQSFISAQTKRNFIQHTW